jgi:hypothetical protein
MSYAGNINVKPNLKKTKAGHRKVEAALKAKKTKYLSDEFKEHLNEVSGQNAANATPIGHQADATAKLNRVRPVGAGTNTSFEG